MPEFLHPIVIHFPVTLGVLMPFIIAASWHQSHPKRIGSRVWTFVLISSSVLLLATVVSFWTGEQDAFLSSGNLEEIEAHRRAAIAFLAVNVLFFLIVLWAFLSRNSMRGYLKLLVFMTSLLQAVCVFWAGHLGGLLTYGN